VKSTTGPPVSSNSGSNGGSNGGSSGSRAARGGKDAISASLRSIGAPTAAKSNTVLLADSNDISRTSKRDTGCRDGIGGEKCPMFRTDEKSASVLALGRKALTSDLLDNPRSDLTSAVQRAPLPKEGCTVAAELGSALQSTLPPPPPRIKSVVVTAPQGDRKLEAKPSSTPQLALPRPPQTGTVYRFPKKTGSNPGKSPGPRTLGTPRRMSGLRALGTPRNSQAGASVQRQGSERRGSMRGAPSRQLSREATEEASQYEAACQALFRGSAVSAPSAPRVPSLKELLATKHEELEPKRPALWSASATVARPLGLKAQPPHQRGRAAWP